MEDKKRYLKEVEDFASDVSIFTEAQPETVFQSQPEVDSLVSATMIVESPVERIKSEIDVNYYPPEVNNLLNHRLRSHWTFRTLRKARSKLQSSGINKILLSLSI